MKAQIYMLSCLETGKFYIGSTVHTLQYRLKKHRSASKEPQREKTALYIHFRSVGWDKAKMTCLSEIEIENRREMFELEKLEILKHIGSELCLNTNRPVITREEKKKMDAEYGKEIRKLDPESERNRVAEWRKKNPEKYREQARRYRERKRNKELNSSKVI